MNTILSCSLLSIDIVLGYCFITTEIAVVLIAIKTGQKQNLKCKWFMA